MATIPDRETETAEKLIQQRNVIQYEIYHVKECKDRYISNPDNGFCRWTFLRGSRNVRLFDYERLSRR